MTDAQRGHPVLAELFRHNLWANLDPDRPLRDAAG